MFFFSGLQAQLLSSWKVKRAQVAMGQDQDLLSTMSPDYFLQTTRSSSQYDYSSLEQLDKQYVYSMVCENPHLRLGINLQHRTLPQLELSLNMLGIFNRIDKVLFATAQT